MKVLNGILKTARLSVVFLKKYAPSILTYLSAASTVGAVVTTAKATWDTKEVIEAHNADIYDIQEDIRACQTPEAEKVHKKKLISKYADTLLDVAENYFLPVTLTGISVASCIISNNISSSRIAALGASCSIMKEMFDKYRDRVKEKYGEEAEKDIYYGAKEVEKEVPGKNGKTKKVKVKEYDSIINNPCAILLGDGIESGMPCDRNDNKNKYKINWLLSKEQILTNRLNSDGYLFMSTIAEVLGIKKAPSKKYHRIWSTWGIIKKESNIQNLYKAKREIASSLKIPYEDPTELEILNANRVSLGLDEEINLRFMSGDEPMVWIIPKLDGDITSFVYPTKQERKYIEQMAD